MKKTKAKAGSSKKKRAAPGVAKFASLNPKGPERGVDVHPEMLAILGKKTIGQVHRGTGISLAHVSRIFGKARTPSMRTADKICKFLGVSMDKFFRALQAAKDRETGWAMGGVTGAVDEIGIEDALDEVNQSGGSGG